MEETQARLTEELVEVCRDHCDATWAEALNIVRVPTNSEWRQPGKVYYHLEIREILVGLLSPSTTAFKSSKQPLTAQAAFSLPKALKGPSQAGDQGQEAEVAKEKGKGKGTKTFSEAKDVVKAKAKETEAKTKKNDPQAKDIPASQLSKKEDPPKAKK